MIFLQTSDRVTDVLGHDSIDRTAIVPPVAQTNLKRADIGWIGEQFASRYEIIVRPRVVPAVKIWRKQSGRLVEDPPKVSGSQRVGGVKKRIIRRARAGNGQSNQREDEEATKGIWRHKFVLKEKD